MGAVVWLRAALLHICTGPAGPAVRFVWALGVPDIGAAMF